jgi:hypothetical protein
MAADDLSLNFSRPGDRGSATTAPPASLQVTATKRRRAQRGRSLGDIDGTSSSVASVSAIRQARTLPAAGPQRARAARLARAQRASGSQKPTTAASAIGAAAAEVVATASSRPVGRARQNTRPGRTGTKDAAKPRQPKPATGSRRLPVASKSAIGDGDEADGMQLARAETGTLNVCARLLRVLTEDLRLSTLTPIQSEAIPMILSGRDTLLQSQTGSGKTLAFLIPMLQKLQAPETRLQRGGGTRAIVLLPTRELCVQVLNVLLAVAKPFHWLVCGSLMGGEKKKAEKARLRKVRWPSHPKLKGFAWENADTQLRFAIVGRHDCSGNPRSFGGPFAQY